MNPKNIQIIQNEIALLWDDQSESYLSLEKLRRRCPCAACAGEQDVMGNTYKPPTALYKPESFQLVRFDPVGGYAVNFVWADGHQSGIYTYHYLKKITL